MIGGVGHNVVYVVSEHATAYAFDADSNAELWHRSLLGAGSAEHSTVGIALAAVSLVVMPFLSHAQRRAGRELGSASAVADAKQTLLCTYLSGVLLVGLLLNSTLGWSWADPIVALVIAAVAVKEGRETWRGEHCC